MADVPTCIFRVSTFFSFLTNRRPTRMCLVQHTACFFQLLISPCNIISKRWDFLYTRRYSRWTRVRHWNLKFSRTQNTLIFNLLRPHLDSRLVNNKDGQAGRCSAIGWRCDVSVEAALTSRRHGMAFTSRILWNIFLITEFRCLNCFSAAKI